MLPGQPQAREPHRADAEAAHEGGQQKAERHGGGADGQLQKLIPDGLVDQRGASAAGEQDEQQGKEARGVGGRRLRWLGHMANVYLSGSGCCHGYRRQPKGARHESGGAVEGLTMLTNLTGPSTDGRWPVGVGARWRRGNRGGGGGWRNEAQLGGRGGGGVAGRLRRPGRVQERLGLRP